MTTEALYRELLYAGIDISTFETANVESGGYLYAWSIRHQEVRRFERGTFIALVSDSMTLDKAISEIMAADHVRFTIDYYTLDELSKIDHASARSRVLRDDDK